MEFIFQVTNYEDPALDGEAVELLRQRLEAKSRQVAPGMWKVTDKLNARAAKGPGRERRLRRYRVYGVILIVLGVLALVPGLMEPRIPSLIVTGSLAVVWGVWSVSLRERKPLRPPASCKKEAAELLAGRRAVDWSEASAEVCFDEIGMTVSAGENREAVPYGDMTGAFETERLWLLVYSGERALLLQKKDLASGEAGDFLSCLQDHINQNHLS